MIKQILEWYWAIKIVWRFKIKKWNRDRWFEGVPYWYMSELVSEDYAAESDELRVLAREARVQFGKII